MPDITISLDEELLKSGRRYAEMHQISMSALIRKLLEQTVRLQSDAWLEECCRLIDQAGGNFKRLKWSRKELYDV